jgi:hypothetical protein
MPAWAGDVEQAVLLDVQSLQGGTELWVAADGRAVCRFVAPPDKGTPGLQETRYEFGISAEQRSALNALIQKHGFFSIRTTDRYGMPDEARPVIFIKSGRSAQAVGKWANDPHKDFDPIYLFLLKTAESGKTGRPVHQGPFDRNWKPDGFPESKGIRDAAGPKINANVTEGS